MAGTDGSRSLNSRADQVAMVLGGASLPMTFQRTLMPRSTMDQALITGLALSANHSLAAMLQQSIEAGALVLLRRTGDEAPDPGRWSRTTIGLDLAALGAGLLAQRAFAARRGERLTRAGVRTGGFWLSAAGLGGSLVGALQEARAVSGRTRGGSLGVVVPATAALAGLAEYQRRRRAMLDAELPPEETSESAGKALLSALGVTAAVAAMAGGERLLATGVANTASRFLPGSEAVWRPLGHLAAMGLVSAGGWTLSRQVFGQIESHEEAVEAAFDIPPPSPFVSGSRESLVPFSTVSKQGRRYVWMATPADRLEEVTGEPALAHPIRAYVGLESGERAQARVDLAVRELDRLGAFERSWLLVDVPTGTGYVNYAAIGALEMLSRGDCATIAMQYSARPSPLSLTRVDQGREQTELLLAAIKRHLADRPSEQRPKLVLFGESLGAWASQDAFLGLGVDGLVDGGVDYAIWIGTPFFSKWKDEVTAAGEVGAGRLARCNDIGEWRALDEATRAGTRYVMVTHYNDAVALFGPPLIIQAPEWLGPPDTRPPTVPKGMRWVPTTGFFQVLVDMKNAATVVPGQFDAKGHDYRADLLPFFSEVLGFEAGEEDLARIRTWLEEQERTRSEWIKRHGATGASLAAAVLERLTADARAQGVDVDRRLVEVIRSVAAEEFGLPGGGAAAPRASAGAPSGQTAAGEGEPGLGGVDDGRGGDAAAP